MIEQDEFLNIVAATPLVSVDLIIRNGAGDVLLGRRVNRPCQGYWFAPGGIVRKNESIRDAVERVARTELGIAVGIDEARFRGVFEHLYDDNFLGAPDVGTHYVVLAYELTVPEATPLVLDDQHSAVKWWDVEELRHDAGVHPNTKAYFMRHARHVGRIRR